jgi:hypothetical protein
MTTIEEEVAQLQVNNKELMSRVASIEQSVVANGGSDGVDPTCMSSTSAWYNDGIIVNMIEPIMLFTAAAGFILVDFI